jgi:hypothetical protein
MELNFKNMQGSPFAVRRAVGQAPSEKKLDVLKQFYPQSYTAEELFKSNPQIQKELNITLDDVGRDNFFYVDNGKLEIYNKPGFVQSIFPPKFDIGDIEERGRDVASALGGIAGASTAFVGGQLGPQALTPEEVFTVPAAAALGSEGAARAYDVVVDMLTPGGTPNRGFLDETKRSAKNIALEYSFGQLGDLGVQGIKNAIKYGGQMASGISPSQLANDFINLGIEPTFGLLSNRRSIANVEEMLLGNPFSADAIVRQRTNLLNSIKEASERISRKYGVPAESKEEAGTLILNATQDARQNFAKRQDSLYGAAYDAAGNVTSDLSNLKELKDFLSGQVKLAPSTLGKDIKPAINQINAILRDASANNNALPLDILRGIRTQVGKNLGPVKGKIRIAKEGDEYLSSIYSALTKDMNAAVKGADNAEALSLLTKADRYTKLNNNLNVRKVFDEVDKRKLPSQVFDFAMQGSDAGATRINSILRNLNAEQRGALSATVLGRLGYRPGQDFSASTFLTNWQKLNPKAKQALFGAEKYREMSKELNSLVRILDVAVERGKAENVSKTATVIQTVGTINSLLLAGGAVTYGVTTGSPGAGAAGATLAGAAMTPVAISSLITSPKFIRWLKGTAQATQRNPNQLGVQLARLGVIAERDSELAPAINEFMNNMAVTLTLPKPQENQQGQ